MAGMPARTWRRLALMGAWRSVAGEVLSRACVVAELDDGDGLVLVAANERWAREIAWNERALRDGLCRATGERISRLVVRVDLAMFGEPPHPGSSSRPQEALSGEADQSPLADGPLRGSTEMGERPSREQGPATPLLDRLESLRERYLAAAAARARSSAERIVPP